MAGAYTVLLAAPQSPTTIVGLPAPNPALVINVVLKLTPPGNQQIGFQYNTPNLAYLATNDPFSGDFSTDFGPLGANILNLSSAATAAEEPLT